MRAESEADFWRFHIWAERGLFVTKYMSLKEVQSFLCVLKGREFNQVYESKNDILTACRENAFDVT